MSLLSRPIDRSKGKRSNLFCRRKQWGAGSTEPTDLLKRDSHCGVVSKMRVSRAGEYLLTSRCCWASAHNCDYLRYRTSWDRSWDRSVFLHLGNFEDLLRTTIDCLTSRTKEGYILFFYSIKRYLSSLELLGQYGFVQSSFAIFGWFDWFWMVVNCTQYFNENPAGFSSSMDSEISNFWELIIVTLISWVARLLLSSNTQHSLFDQQIHVVLQVDKYNSNGEVRCTHIHMIK